MGNHYYDPGEEKETIKLSNGIVIKEVNIQDIVFVPPEPNLFLVALDTAFMSDGDKGNIIVGSETGKLSKTITIDWIGNLNSK